MSDPAIRVENLSKLYRIGGKQEGYKTLRDTLSDAVHGPVKAVRALFSRNGHKRQVEEEFWALKDVSFEVQRGDVVGIIGRNGAGKSTLLKILSRITEPTKGHAEIHGRVGSLLEVGTGFHPELSGRENVFLNGAILGMKRDEIEKRFDEIVAFAEVEKFIDTPVKHYSSGMYLRLAFAVAAHLDPEILIVDEVLAVGDMSFQRKCLGKMEDISKAGRTILFVSHNMGAISNLCSKCIWLDAGSIVEQGSTEDVIAHYISTDTSNGSEVGFSDLRATNRSAGLRTSIGQFQSVRTLNSKGQQASAFLEREAITIEAVFTLRKGAANLQFGCSVARIHPSVELFTVPSKVYRNHYLPDEYTIQLRLDPNYLRSGGYKIALKMFSDGHRLDTVGDVLRFVVNEYVSPDQDSSYFAKWNAGTLWLPYHWNEVQTADSMQHLVDIGENIET